MRHPMENLQDILTLAATVVEYVFFAYLAIAFMVYSLKSPSPTQSVRPTSAPAASVPHKVWEPTAKSGVPLAGAA